MTLCPHEGQEVVPGTKIHHQVPNRGGDHKGSTWRAPVDAGRGIRRNLEDVLVARGAGGGSRPEIFDQQSVGKLIPEDRQRGALRQNLHVAVEQAAGFEDLRTADAVHLADTHGILSVDASEPTHAPSQSAASIFRAC